MRHSLLIAATAMAILLSCCTTNDLSVRPHSSMAVAQSDNAGDSNGGGAAGGGGAADRLARRVRWLRYLGDAAEAEAAEAEAADRNRRMADIAARDRRQMEMQALRMKKAEERRREGEEGAAAVNGLPPPPPAVAARSDTIEKEQQALQWKQIQDRKRAQREEEAARARVEAEERRHELNRRRLGRTLLTMCRKDSRRLCAGRNTARGTGGEGFKRRGISDCLVERFSEIVDEECRHFIEGRNACDEATSGNPRCTPSDSSRRCLQKFEPAELSGTCTSSDYYAAMRGKPRH